MHGVTARLALASVAVGVLLCCGCTDPDGEDGGDIEIEVLDEMPTVAYVRWPAPEGVDEAKVEVGEGEEYGRAYEAAVVEDRFEARVLGLRPLTQYHLRVGEWQGDEWTYSEERTFTTGPPPSDLYGALPSGEAPDGWVVTTLVRVPSVAAILDPEGVVVWWYYSWMQSGGHAIVTRTSLARDGDSVVLLAWTPMYPGMNPLEERELIRVGFDGVVQGIEGVVGAHHDFVEHGDGTFGMLSHDPIDADGVEVVGDRIVELRPDGEVVEIWSLWDEHEPDPGIEYTDQYDYSHGNAIRYDEDRGIYYVSLRELNQIVAVDRATGDVLWRLGGEGSDYTTGGGSTDLFENQHQFRVLEQGILVFDNGEDGATESRGLEYALEEDHATAVWSHEPDPPLGVFSLGDVQRFDDGDTMITWSSSGRISRVSAGGGIEWALSLELGNGFGYAEWVDKLPGQL